MDKTFDKIDEMLKRPYKLAKTELTWVKRIDKTVARFNNTEITPRQREVINDIHTRFKERSG
jgi:hypothetical protein